MPNERIREIMKAKNIQPLRLPQRISNISKLDGINDPKLPKQIAKELAGREDVLEIQYYEFTGKDQKGEYRVKLKSSDNFNICIFYTSL